MGVDRPAGWPTPHHSGPRGAARRRPGRVPGRVVSDLRRGRSPAAVCADLEAEEVPGRPCPETVYQALYRGALGLRANECLRTRRRGRHRRGARTPRPRPHGPRISQRPAAANGRSEAGHWEADRIIGARNRSSMIRLVERQTRYSVPVTMPDGYTAEAALAGLIEGFDQIPPHLRRPATFDRGPEWANWPTSAAHYGLDVWLCDPH